LPARLDTWPGASSYQGGIHTRSIVRHCQAATATWSHSSILPAKVRAFETGGYIHVTTDWEDYAEQTLHVLSQEPQLSNTAADYALRPD